jgi:YVTN family beta-propeller protein
VSIIENDVVERVLQEAKVRGARLRRRRRLLSLSVVSALALSTAAVVGVVATSGPSNSGGIVPAGGYGPTAYVFGPNGTDITPIDTTTNTAGPMIVLPESSGDIGHLTNLVVTPNGRTAYVGNATSSPNAGSVTQIDTATRTAGPAIAVGGHPEALVISPNGRTVFVAVTDDGGVLEIVPIDTSNNSVGKPIPLPGSAFAAVATQNHALAITPNGKTLYVAVLLNPHAGTPDVGGVIPVDIATGQVGGSIKTALQPSDIAITPNGTTVYVLCLSYGKAGHLTDEVFPIDTRTDALGRAIRVGPTLSSLAMAPNGKTVYVPTLNGVFQIDVSTNTAGRTIELGQARSMAISSNSERAYIVLETPGAEGRVVSLDLTTDSVGKAILVGTGGASDVAYSPDDATAYVVNPNSSTGTVTPIDTATNTPEKAITVGPGPIFIVIAP